MKVREIDRVLVTVSLLLLTLGVVLTSAQLVAVSAYPLILALIPAIPPSVEVAGISLKNTCRVNEEVDVKVRLRVRGFGFVKIMHLLPENFEVKRGSNALAGFVFGSAEVSLEYTFTPLKRGKFSLDRIFVEYNSLLGVRRGKKEVRVPVELEVKSGIYRIRKFEVRRSIARNPMPEFDVSKIGVPGTDFREIRKYVSGDPVKFINWKASAKLGELMVNQYEVEGKKTVWIILDANSYMLHGTLRNFFEAAVEVANSLSYYFAVRGYRVGMYIVGASELVYPDTGRKQFEKISKILTRIECSDKIEDFLKAVETSRKYIEAYKPASIFITRVEHSRPVRAVVKAMGKRKLPVLVIALKTEMGENLASSVVDAMRRSIIMKLRNAGAEVIEVDISKPAKVLTRVAR